MPHRPARFALALVALLAPMGGCYKGDSPGAESPAPDASVSGGQDAGFGLRGDGGGPAPDAASGGGGTGTAGPFRLVGRFDTTDPTKPRFGWPGTQARARFTGTSITLSVTDTGGDVLGVSIDGAPITKVTATASQTSYPLATGLAAGAHTLVLTKLTESNVGTAQLLGLAVDPGATVQAAPEPSARHLEVLGDSASCGYGVEGADASCHFSPATENVTLAYPALTASALGAEYVVTAYSGIGVSRDYGGSTQDQLPVRWLRTLAEVSQSTWDFARYTPDVVVINVGTNDFATGVVPQGTFVPAYASFVQAVRGKYPGALILCALPSTVGDDYPAGATHRTILRGYLQGVVSGANGGGDAKVQYFEFDEQLAADGYGCDYHPSKITQQKMAQKLTAAIKTAMGW